MSFWPVNMPPLDVRFTSDPGFKNKRLLMDSNRTRQYPQFTTGLERVNVQWQMNPDQLHEFRWFYSVELNQGERWFLMDAPNPDYEVLVQTEVRFLGAYTERLTTHDNWLVTATLEYKEASTMPKLDLEPIGMLPDGTLVWPDHLLGNPSGFNVKYDPANVVSNIDTGRVNIRARATQRTEMVSLTFDFNQLQYAQFRCFFEKYLNLGTDWFMMWIPAPLEGGGQNLRLLRAKFNDDYSASYVPLNNWDIKCSVEYELPDDMFHIV